MTHPYQEITATITALSHDGRGVAHIDGKTVFIFGALPGEKVTFHYTKRKNNYDEGNAVKIHIKSPQRQNAKCQHFSTCGGCHLQHFSHESQIEHKQKVLLELLQHQANIQPKEILSPIVANPWGYRRKARLSVKYLAKKEKLVVGFHEKNGRFVTDMERCEVLHPSVGQYIRQLRELLMQLNARAHIPQIEIAVGNNTTAMIVRHLLDLNDEDLQRLTIFAQRYNFYVFLQPESLNSIHLFYPKTVNSLLTYSLSKYDIELKFYPEQFIQINQHINEQMIAQTLSLLQLQPTDKVLDLFCGIGNFTLPIGKYCAKITGIEADTKAISQAKRNAELNHIRNCQFFCADLFQDCSHMSWANIHYDKIFLDPPRAGAKEILQHINKWKPSQILYVSCNPMTLARDTKILIQKGYQLNTAGIMDMFPHTQHVEVMCLFIMD